MLHAQISGYIHLYPGAQQEPGASIAVHSVIWINSQKHIQITNDKVICFALQYR